LHCQVTLVTFCMLGTCHSSILWPLRQATFFITTQHWNNKHLV
jgi:hypothetical protein